LIPIFSLRVSPERDRDLALQARLLGLAATQQIVVRLRHGVLLS
jgi:hypothetical protein